MFVFPIIIWIYQEITDTVPPYNRCEPRWESDVFVSDCTDEEARIEEEKIRNR